MDLAEESSIEVVALCTENKKSRKKFGKFKSVVLEATNGTQNNSWSQQERKAKIKSSSIFAVIANLSLFQSRPSICSRGVSINPTKGIKISRNRERTTKKKDKKHLKAEMEVSKKLEKAASDLKTYRMLNYDSGVPKFDKVHQPPELDDDATITTTSTFRSSKEIDGLYFVKVKPNRKK